MPVLREAGDRAAFSISIVVLDDNRLFRDGLTLLLQRHPDLRLLVALADVEEALELMHAAKPDVLLLDVGLKDHESLRLTAALHIEIPTMRVILTGLLPNDADVASYVRAGAAGFIMKDASVDEYVLAIRAVAAGEEALPAPLIKFLFLETARSPTSGRMPEGVQSMRLTAREREVVEFLADGLSNKEIAKRLDIAVHTVKSHVHSILEKLALESRRDLLGLRRSASR